MPAFTEEEKRILLQTPIELILSHFGKATEHRRGNMFYSPFRDECTPSFHVNPNNNTWYDFGAGEGGGIIDIVTRLAGCSRSQAYDFLTSVRKDFVALSQYSYPKEKQTELTDIVIQTKKEELRKQLFFNHLYANVRL